MTWPRTIADLINLAVMAVGPCPGLRIHRPGAALGCLHLVGLPVRRDPDLSIFDAIRFVLLLALLAVLALAFETYSDGNQLPLGSSHVDRPPALSTAVGYARIAHLSAPRVTSAVKRPSPSGVMTKRPRA